MKFPYFHGRFDIFAWLATIAVFLLSISEQHFIIIIKLLNLLIFIICALIILNSKTSSVIKKFSEETKSYLKYILLIIFFILLGQFVSSFHHNNTAANVYLFHNYLRVAFNGFFFLLTAFLIFQNESLIKYFSWAIFFTPIVVFPLFLGFLGDIYLQGGRLSGLLTDPNIFGNWTSMAFIIGIAIFLKIKKKWQCLLIFSWLCLIANFILWSASRESWVALVVGLTIFVLILLFKKQYYEITWVLIIPILAFLIGFLTLPNSIKPFIADRMIGTKIIEMIDSKKALQKYNPNYNFSYENGFLSNQIRPEIWKNTFLTAFKNPLGYGFNYLFNNKFTLKEETISFAGNIFIEIFIFGGLGGLIAFLIILKKLIQNIPLIFKKTNKLSIAWIAIFFMTIIEYFFNDGFLFRYLWFILGVILGLYLIEKFKSSNVHTDQQQPPTNALPLLKSKLG